MLLLEVLISNHLSLSSWWRTPSRALLYWRLDAKYPFPLPSSKPCGPQSSGPNVLVYHSQPGGSWSTRRSPPIRWWSQRGSDDMVVVLLWSWSSQVPEKPQPEQLDLFRDWQATRDAPDCVVCSVPGGSPGHQ